jgi:protoporphyrinogen IX oxidase
MLGVAPLLVFLHVTANIVWVGSVLAIATVISSAAAEPEALGRIGVRVHQQLAMPAFAVSLVTGGARLAMDTGYYFGQTKFMHGKLFLALVVIGLDHAIRGRAKRMASGTAKGPSGAAGLAVGVLVAAAGAVFFAVVKPF